MIFFFNSLQWYLQFPSELHRIQANCSHIWNKLSKASKPNVSSHLMLSCAGVIPVRSRFCLCKLRGLSACVHHQIKYVNLIHPQIRLPIAEDKQKTFQLHLVLIKCGSVSYHIRETPSRNSAGKNEANLKLSEVKNVNCYFTRAN